MITFGTEPYDFRIFREGVVLQKHENYTHFVKGEIMWTRPLIIYLKHDSNYVGG